MPLRPITVLIGPNNVGKSTLLQAILLLKQSLEDTSIRDALITTGPWANLGSFYDILRGGHTGRPKSFTIDVGIPEDEAPAHGVPAAADGVPVANELSVTFALNRRADRIDLQSGTYSHDGDPIFSVSSAGKQWSGVTSAEPYRRHVVMHPIGFLPRVHPIGRPPEDPETVRTVLDEVQKSQYCAYLWQDVLEDVRYVAPIRQPVPRYGVFGEVRPRVPGIGGLTVINQLRDKKRREFANDWVSHRFRLLRSLDLINVDPDGQISSLVGDEVDGFSGINVANMGQGVSQLLPVVAAASIQRQGRSVLVEQPEAHLHPAAQADLADLFIAASVSGKNRQFIVETHSEHLLLRLRRRVAEGLDPDLVSILFVERRRAQSVVERLDLTDVGNFERWPAGFFEEGYREAIALAQASHRRQQSR